MKEGPVRRKAPRRKGRANTREGRAKHAERTKSILHDLDTDTERQVKSSQAKSSQVKSSQAKPSQMKKKREEKRKTENNKKLKEKKNQKK